MTPQPVKQVITRKTIEAWTREECPNMSPEAVAALTTVCINVLIKAGLLTPAPGSEEEDGASV